MGLGAQAPPPLTSGPKVFLFSLPLETCRAVWASLSSSPSLSAWSQNNVTESSRGPHTFLSLHSGLLFHLPLLMSALYMPSRKEFPFPKGITSFQNRARAFWMLSRTLKKWKVKTVWEQGSLGDLRLWGCLKAVCVFDKNHWRVGPL